MIFHQRAGSDSCLCHKLRMRDVLLSPNPCVSASASPGNKFQKPAPRVQQPFDRRRTFASLEQEHKIANLWPLDAAEPRGAFSLRSDR